MRIICKIYLFITWLLYRKNKMLFKFNKNETWLYYGKQTDGSVKLFIENKKFSELPQTIAIYGKRKGAVLVFYDLQGIANLEFVLNKCKNFFAINETSKTIQGDTNIYGYCMSVGGETPKITIKKNDDNGILICDVNKELAKEVGKRLYDKIELEGVAQWDVETGAIIDFYPKKLMPYKETDPVTAIKSLKKAFNGAYDNINPDEFINELRNEE